MAEHDARYEGNGGPAPGDAGAHAQAEHAAAAAAAGGGSPPAAGPKPTGFSDHADGRASQPQVRARAAPI